VKTVLKECYSPEKLQESGMELSLTRQCMLMYSRSKKAQEELVRDLRNTRLHLTTDFKRDSRDHYMAYVGTVLPKVCKIRKGAARRAINQ